MNADRMQRQRGWTVAELLATLALVSIGLTASFSVLYQARVRDRETFEATERILAAESVMERLAHDPTLRTPGRTTLDLPGITDEPVVVDVHAEPNGTRTVEVTVGREPRRVRLVTRMSGEGGS